MRKLVVLFCVMAFATASFAGGDLDEFKGKAITVVFVAGKQKTRENAIEQIQGMVGNPVKRSFVSSLNRGEINDLMSRRIIDKGMIPKVEACLRAIDAGVNKAHIIDGRLEHSLLLEIFTDKGVGTQILQ